MTQSPPLSQAIRLPGVAQGPQANKNTIIRQDTQGSVSASQGMRTMAGTLREQGSGSYYTTTHHDDRLFGSGKLLTRAITTKSAVLMSCKIPLLEIIFTGAFPWLSASLQLWRKREKLLFLSCWNASSPVVRKTYSFKVIEMGFFRSALREKKIQPIDLTTHSVGEDTLRVFSKECVPRLYKEFSTIMRKRQPNGKKKKWATGLIRHFINQDL